MSIQETFGDKLKMLGMRKTKHRLSENDVKAIEVEVGVSLPADFREFLLEMGGVSFKAALVVRPIDQSKGSYHYVSWLYAGKGDDSLVAPYQDLQDRLTENIVPIASDPGGNKYCLTVKGPGVGRVFYWDHEDGKLYLTADSFHDFLARLEPSPD